MLNFRVPTKAVRHIEDIKKGVTYYEINGSKERPVYFGSFVVTELPAPRSRIKPEESYWCLSDKYFFEVQDTEHSYDRQCSCTDLNVGQKDEDRYNNNWLFTSKEDAEEAILEMQGLRKVVEVTFVPID